MNLYFDLVVFTVLLTSFIINNNLKYKSVLKIKTVENKIMKILIIFLLIMFPISGLIGGFSFKLITISRYLLYVPLLYNAFLRIYQGVRQTDFEIFIDKVIVINTLFAIFYIIDSSGAFTIYPGEKYLTELTATGIIIRNFDTFPPLTIFVISFILSKLALKERKAKYIIILAINFIAVFFTYTRSMFGSLILIILITIFKIILTTKRKKFSRIFAILSFLLISSYFISSNYLSDQLSYFLSRLNINKIDLIQDYNLVSRLALTNAAIEVSGQLNNIWFGAGYLAEARKMMDLYWSAWTGDVMWTTFLLHSGIIGSIIFLLFIIAIIIRLLLDLKYSEYLKHGLVLLCIFYLIMSFFSEGFLGYFYLPIMYLALSEVTLNNLWYKDINLNRISKKMAI